MWLHVAAKLVKIRLNPADLFLSFVEVTSSTSNCITCISYLEPIELFRSSWVCARVPLAKPTPFYLNPRRTCWQSCKAPFFLPIGCAASDVDNRCSSYPVVIGAPERWNCLPKGAARGTRELGLMRRHRHRSGRAAHDGIERLERALVERLRKGWALKIGIRSKLTWGSMRQRAHSRPLPRRFREKKTDFQLQDVSWLNLINIYSLLHRSSRID